MVFDQKKIFDPLLLFPISARVCIAAMQGPPINPCMLTDVLLPFRISDEVIRSLFFCSVTLQAEEGQPSEAYWSEAVEALMDARPFKILNEGTEWLLRKGYFIPELDGYRPSLDLLKLLL